MSVGEVQKVLVNLLKEEIPIRNLVTILETLADYSPHTKDLDLLTEYVRQALARQITKQVTAEDGIIRVITLDPQLEQILLKIQQDAREGAGYSVDPEVVQKIYAKMGELIQKMTGSGHQPVVLCSPPVRLTFRKLTERLSAKLMILSYNELVPEAEVHSVGVVAVNQ
jgi:flagellar biosynthesis protein FlhA